MIYPIILLPNAANRGGKTKKLNWQPLSFKIDTAIGSVPESYITLYYIELLRLQDFQNT